jgi:hypothetical protein
MAFQDLQKEVQTPRGLAVRKEFIPNDSMEKAVIIGQR